MWLLQAFSEQVPSSAEDLQEQQGGLQILRLRASNQAELGSLLSKWKRRIGLNK